ncbi:MAG: hypothetical protein WBM07_00050 [Chitinivibrionales bacterium]
MKRFLPLILIAFFTLAAAGIQAQETQTSTGSSVMRSSTKQKLKTKHRRHHKGSKHRKHAKNTQK